MIIGAGGNIMIRFIVVFVLTGLFMSPVSGYAEKKAATEELQALLGALDSSGETVSEQNELKELLGSLEEESPNETKQPARQVPARKTAKTSAQKPVPQQSVRQPAPSGSTVTPSDTAELRRMLEAATEQESAAPQQESPDRIAFMLAGAGFLALFLLRRP